MVNREDHGLFRFPDEPGGFWYSEVGSHWREHYDVGAGFANPVFYHGLEWWDLPFRFFGLIGFIILGQTSFYKVVEDPSITPVPVLTETEGPRLESLKVNSSAYGKGRAVMYGTCRLPGEIIWAAGIGEVANRTVVSTDQDEYGRTTADSIDTQYS